MHAMTIHKSQGSQADEVVVILPAAGVAAADPRAVLHRDHPRPGARRSWSVTERPSAPRSSAGPARDGPAATAPVRAADHPKPSRHPPRVTSSVPFLLRVELPDVPGSLGRLATAIGEAGGDIEAIEIVEKRHDGTAVDDVLLEMHGGAMPDSIVSACNALDGVQVLWINRYAAGGNLFLDLEAVEELTDRPREGARPGRRPAAGRVPRRLGGAGAPAARRRPAHRRARPTRCRSSSWTRRPDSRSTATSQPLRGRPHRRQRAGRHRPARRTRVRRLRARPARPPGVAGRLARAPLTPTRQKLTPNNADPAELLPGQRCSA